MCKINEVWHDTVLNISLIKFKLVDNNQMGFSKFITWTQINNDSFFGRNVSNEKKKEDLNVEKCSH